MRPRSGYLPDGRLGSAGLRPEPVLSAARLHRAEFSRYRLAGAWLGSSRCRAPGSVRDGPACAGSGSLSPLDLRQTAQSRSRFCPTRCAGASPCGGVPPQTRRRPPRCGTPTSFGPCSQSGAKKKRGRGGRAESIPPKGGWRNADSRERGVRESVRENLLIY